MAIDFNDLIPKEKQPSTVTLEKPRPGLLSFEDLIEQDTVPVERTLDFEDLVEPVVETPPLTHRGLPRDIRPLPLKPPIETPPIMLKSKQYEGFFNELVTAGKAGFLNVASGLAGTVAAARRKSPLGTLARTFRKESVRARNPELAKLLGIDPGKTWETWAQDLYKKARQPAYTPSQGGGVKGFIANAVGRTFPFMAAAVGSTLLTGTPMAAFGTAFAVEGDNAYREALATGASEEQANLERVIVGTINGAIEQMQINHLFRFARGGGGSIARQVVDAARKKAWSKLAKAGGRLTIAQTKIAINEGIEEALQEIVSQTVPMLHGKELPSMKELGEQVGMAGLGGAVAGGILGGAGAAFAEAPAAEVKPLVLSPKTIRSMRPATAPRMPTEPSMPTLWAKTPTRPTASTINEQYSRLVDKWGDDAIDEAQAVLSDENETYQDVEGEFVDLDSEGKGETPEADRLQAQLFKMTDDYLSERKAKAPAKPSVVAKVYEGKAYRYDTGQRFVGKTAADIARFEQEELENELGITPKKLAELENYPASQLVWVARTKRGAARYAAPAGEEITPKDLAAVDDVSESIKGGEIITELPDGVLVLKALAKPAPAAEVGKIAELQTELRKLETLAPRMSEGAISATQLNRMSKRQRVKYDKDMARRYDVEAEIRELQKTPEQRAKEEKAVVAKKTSDRLLQIKAQIDMLQRTGIGKRGIVKPSYQKRIDELEAEREALAKLAITPAKPTVVAPKITIPKELSTGVQDSLTKLQDAGFLEHLNYDPVTKKWRAFLTDEAGVELGVVQDLQHAKSAPELLGTDKAKTLKEWISREPIPLAKPVAKEITATQIDKQYADLNAKWDGDTIAEAQETLSDENEDYQDIEGEFVLLDKQGKGTTPEANRLQAQLFRMVDDYLTRKAKPAITPTRPRAARPKDLIGRPALEGGAAGEQAEFLEKEEYRLPEADIEGQMKLRPKGMVVAPKAEVGKVAWEILNSRGQRLGKTTYPSRQAAQRALEKRITSPIARTQFSVEIIKPTPTEKPTRVVPKGKVPVRVKKKFYTSVPEGWRKVEVLYDWGAKGLRSQGNRYVADGKKRKTFIWQSEVGEIPTGNQVFLREVKKRTDEVWPVKERRGKFWTTSHYLAPKQVISDVKVALGIEKLKPSKVARYKTTTEIVEEVKQERLVEQKKALDEFLNGIDEPSKRRMEPGFVAVPQVPKPIGQVLTKAGRRAKIAAKNIEDDIDKFRFYPKVPPAFRNAVRIDLIGASTKATKIVYENAAKVIWTDLDAKDIRDSVEIIYARDQLSRTKLGKGNPEINLEEATGFLDDALTRASLEAIVAADRWKQIHDKYTAKLIERGVLEEGQQIEDHVRHYVEDYTPEWAPTFGIPTRLKRPFRGYAKRAVGTVKEYRQDKEALLASLMEMEYHNLVEDFIETQVRKYDIKPNLSEEARRKLFGTDTRGYAKVPRPGRIYIIDGKRYRAYTPDIPFSRAIYMTENGEAALGSFKNVALVPEDMYNVFRDFSQRGSRAIYLLNRVTGYWKTMAILAHYPSFNVNNFVGDTWVAMVQHPAPLELLSEYDTAIKYILQDIREKPRSGYLKQLENFVDKHDIKQTFAQAELSIGRKSKNPIAWLLRKSYKFSDHRETINRVAYASSLLKAMQRGDGPKAVEAHDWIDTEGLSAEDALGKISREVLTDYQNISKPFRRFVRGGVFPFGTWYFKTSTRVWRWFSKHPLKATMLFMALPIAAAAYNRRRKEIQQLEMQMPEFVRNRVHFILGENPDGTIRVLSLQLPQDVLIGTKIFSIATDYGNRVLNKELTPRQAAIEMLKTWGISEAKGVAYLLSPWIRFFQGWGAEKDPYDKAPVFKRGYNKMTWPEREIDLAAYFIKCSVPFLGYTIQTYEKGLPQDIALKKMWDTLASKGALGIYDVNKKGQVVLEKDGKKTIFEWKDIHRIRNLTAKEYKHLGRLEDSWVASGQSVSDFIATEKARKPLLEIYSVWSERVPVLKTEKDKNARIRIVVNALGERLTNRFTSPRIQEKWYQVKLVRAKTVSEKRQIAKEYAQVRKERLIEAFRMQPKTAREIELVRKIKQMD